MAKLGRVAVGNNKGGTGKTTAVTNTAAALAEEGLNVLVVDMDPQANSSRRLGRGPDPARPVVGTAEIIADGREGVAAEAIVSCDWPEPYRSRIQLIPARLDLENRVAEAGVLGAHQRLANALRGADDHVHVTLFDLPPSLGHLTQLALAAADKAWCTLDPEYEAVEGAQRFRDFVVRHGHQLNPAGIDLIGYYVGRVRARIGEHDFQLAGLDESLGAGMAWTPHIPDRAAVKDAAAAGVPLRVFGTAPARAVAGKFSLLGRRLVAKLAA